MYTAGVLTASTDYFGKVVYEDEQPAFALFADGRAMIVPGETAYLEFHLKDHLGNVRVTLRKNAAGAPEVLQENAYYPFGLVIQDLSVSSTTTNNNKFKYNNKELQSDHGLEWYDYGARFYDPQLARWFGVDPLAEISRRWSPYAYCYNNPVRFIDPDGMLVDDIYNYAGQFLGSTSSGDNIRILNATQEQYNTMPESYVLNNSKVVTVENAESVNAKLDNMLSQTNMTGGVEAKAYVVLDTENATLTLDIQPQSSGDSKHSSENLYEGPIEIGGDSYIKPMGGSDYDVIVGQAHGHNADKSGYNADGSSGYTYNTTEIKQGASTDDAGAAQTLNVPVHAIDGNNGQVTRILPSGKPKTTVDRSTLLRQSLEIYGGKL